MSDAVRRQLPFAVLEAEEPRMRQQREMARLWMALNAVRQAEASPAPPRRAPPAFAGSWWLDAEAERPGRT